MHLTDREEEWINTVTTGSKPCISEDSFDHEIGLRKRALNSKSPLQRYVIFLFFLLTYTFIIFHPRQYPVVIYWCSSSIYGLQGKSIVQYYEYQIYCVSYEKTEH